jgi:chromate transporter
VEAGTAAERSRRPRIADALAERVRPSLRRTARTAAVWLAVWLAPLGLLRALLGPESVFVREGMFFSKVAVVTFGGAYAVLAYVAQQAVDVFGWLAPGEMLDGLGMAETTPGPLIQVVQFVGFMGAHRHAEGIDPMLAGVLGSLVVTWATFAPCFLWIFAGAPWVETLRGRRGLATALSAITAAVVGVILNLAVWFGLNTLFAEVGTRVWNGVRLYVPVWQTVDLAALAIAALAFVALVRWRLGMIKTLAASAALGALWFLLAGG